MTDSVSACFQQS